VRLLNDARKSPEDAAVVRSPSADGPVPGIAHGAIPGLLGIALNGQAPPADDAAQGGRKTITAEDLRSQLYREHGRPPTFARRFDAWPAVSPTRGGDIPTAPQTADFGVPPQVGASPPQQSPDAQSPDTPRSPVRQLMWGQRYGRALHLHRGLPDRFRPPQVGRRLLPARGSCF
jgi:hypothetical protein